MKTSNIIITTTFVLFIIGFAFNAAGLKRMYDHIDWKDPYRDYTKYPLKGFVKNIYVEVMDTTDHPSASTVTIIQGDSSKLMISSGPKLKNVQWQITDSGLVIRLKNYADVALMLPKVQSLSTYRVNCEMKGFDLDSLQLTAGEEYGKITVHKSKIHYLDASILKHGQINIPDSNQIAKLHLRVQGGIFRSGIDYEETSRSISPDSKVEVAGKALQWIK